MDNSKREEIIDECLTEIAKYKRSTCAVSMGVGKTFIGLSHMDKIREKGGRRFLVVAPKVSIFDTWEEEIDKHGFYKDFVAVDITYTTYRSINKQNPEDFDGVYLDECHNLLETHEPFLSAYKGPILGLTGTPPKWKNSVKGLLVAKYCPVKYEYFTDDAVDDGILNDYSIIVHRLKLDTRKNHRVTTKKFNFLTSEKSSYAYACKRLDEANTPKQTQFARIGRMTIMKSYRSKETYAKNLLTLIDEKCIIFCNTTAQADRMCKFSYHSKNHKDVNEMNITSFKGGNTDRLSCVEQLSEGANIPNLKNSIIIHAYGNEKKLRQRLGRTLRLKPDEKATIHVLMYEDTIDEKWVRDALSDFDEDKITYVNPLEL